MKKYISLLLLSLMILACGGGKTSTGAVSGIKDLKGKEVKLEQFSVSHYLLLRALEKNGLKESDVTIVNTPGDEAGQLFLSGGADVVTTWNPHLFLAEEQGKGQVIFSSKDIPGEIIDMLVVDQDVIKENPAVAASIVHAWYDAMAYITDPATRDDAIAIMAKAAGASTEDFEKMLGGTQLFTKAKETAAFLKGKKILDTEKKVKDFSKSHDLIQKDISITMNASYIEDYIAKKAKPAAKKDGKVYKIGISIWTGWMPFWLIKEKGFLEKRNKEFGVNVQLEEYKEYMASVESFSAKNVVGCAMTIMEALQPANSGLAVEAIVINDISHGGDGILVKTAK